MRRKSSDKGLPSYEAVAARDDQLPTYEEAKKMRTKQ